MSKLFSQQRLLALVTLALFALVAADAQAQTGSRQQQGGRAAGRQIGGGQGGGGQAGGGQSGGIGASNEGPSGAVTGEISRSADRVLSDGGQQTGARGGAAGLGGLGGMRGLGGMGMGGFGGLSPFGANPFGAGAATETTPSVRTRLRADIQTPARSPQRLSAQVQRRVMASTPASRRVDGFAVTVTDGVATVSGTVASERDRRMAELVLRLEPGVRQVDNQIVVAP